MPSIIYKWSNAICQLFTRYTDNPKAVQSNNRRQIFKKKTISHNVKKAGRPLFSPGIIQIFFLCKTFLLNILTFNFVTTTRPFLFRIIIVIKTNAYFFNTNFLRIFLRWIGKKLSVYTLYNNNKAQKPRRTRPGFREERAVLWISKK